MVACAMTRVLRRETRASARRSRPTTRTNARVSTRGSECSTSSVDRRRVDQPVIIGPMCEKYADWFSTWGKCHHRRRLFVPRVCGPAPRRHTRARLVGLRTRTTPRTTSTMGKGLDLDAWIAKVRRRPLRVSRNAPRVARSPLNEPRIRTAPRVPSRRRGAGRARVGPGRDGAARPAPNLLGGRRARSPRRDAAPRVGNRGRRPARRRGISSRAPPRPPSRRLRAPLQTLTRPRSPRTLFTSLFSQIKQCEPLEESELEALCGYVKEVLVEESNVQPVNSPSRCAATSTASSTTC